MKLYLNTKDIASFFGISDRAIRKWYASGCPREEAGKWDLKSVFDWWWDNIAQSRAADESGDKSLNEAKRRYWWQKAEGEEIKNKQLKGDLVPWSEIENEWTPRVSAVTSGLEALADSLPPILEGKNRKEMRLLIGERVRIVREAYAREGRFCPSVKSGDSGDTPAPSKSKKVKKSTKGGKGSI